MKIRPIKTEGDYKEALREVSAYFDNEPEPNTPDGDHFEILLILIADYESKLMSSDADGTVIRAKSRNMDLGGVLKASPSEDDKMLDWMIDQMNKTAAQASAAIDESLAYVEASNKRISAMEKCPLCEVGELHEKTRMVEQECLGHKRMLPLQFSVCDHCETETLTLEQSRANKLEMQIFRVSVFREALMAPQLLMEEPFNGHYYDLRGLPRPIVEEFYAAVGKTTRVGFGVFAGDWEPWRDKKLKKLEITEGLLKLPKQSCQHCEFYDLGPLPEEVRAQYFRDRPIDQRPIVEGAEWPVYASDFERWRRSVLGKDEKSEGAA